MNFFSRLSFHHRIFVLIGLFVTASIGAMWLFVLPVYERQVIEERTTVVQELQHFAVRSVDETIDRWLNIAQYLSWNLQKNPNDVAILIRQQIAFDTSLIQIVLSSPDLSDEFVATSSAHPSFSFHPAEHRWSISDKDSTIAMLWIDDSLSGKIILGIRKKFSIDGQKISLTMYADTKSIIHLLINLPIGGPFVVHVVSDKGNVYRNSNIDFPIAMESWHNLTVMQDVNIEQTEWKLLFSKFFSAPAFLLIGIPTDVVLQPVQTIFMYSIFVVIILTMMVGVLGWVFSRQLSRPVSQLVMDVERLKTLDFSQPISVPQLREIASVAETIESMRTVLERYQRMNVEKIIFEEWKNKFFLMHSDDAICMTDESKSIIFMNDTFGQMKGGLEKTSPVNDLRQFIDHPNIQRSKEHSRTEQSGMYSIGFLQAEISITLPESEPRFARFHEVSIGRDNGHLGSLAIVHDLTNDRLIDKAKTEMINFIAHELKNPLNSVMGFASLIMEEEDMEKEERTKFAKIIHQSSKTMNQLINRFLDVQRLESHSVEYHKEPTDLVSLAKFVCDSQKPQLDAKTLTLDFAADENIPKITVSPDLMREAFVNLVSNAVKYGDEKRSIIVEMKNDAENVRFIITDHGYGISAEDQQKLFSKFFRVTSNKKAADQLGTGLGLAHVKEVMNYHHGDVSLESNSEIGCRFTLTIPKS